MYKSYQVNIATLKAKLSEYLRLIGKGHTVLVLDRKHVVAKLSPVISEEENTSIKPTENPNLSDFDFGKPVKRHMEIDSTQLLVQERQRR